MVELWTNNANSTLAVGINGSDTTVTVGAGHGARFPNPAGADFFWCTLEEGSTIEIVKCTSRATDALTVTRAQQGTTGVAFTTAAKVELRLTKGGLESLQVGGIQALSAGTQSVTSGSIVFSDSNSISFGMSGSSRITASIEFPAQTVQTQGLIAALSAGTQSVTTGTMVFSNSNNVTFGMSGSSLITASASFAGGGIDRSYHEVLEGERFTTAAQLTGASFSKRPIFIPFWMDGNQLSVKTVQYLMSRSAGTSLNMTAGIGFYSMVNATRIDLVSSTSHGYSLTTSAQWSGVRVYQFTGLSNFTLSEGRWIAALYFSGSNNSTAVCDAVLIGADAMPTIAGFVHMGTNSTAATNTLSQMLPFWGVYSATTAAFPATVPMTAIAGQNSTVACDIYLLIKEI